MDYHNYSFLHTIKSTISFLVTFMKNFFFGLFLCFFAQLAAAQSNCDLGALKTSTGLAENAQTLQRKLAVSDPCKIVPGMKAKSLIAVWGMFLSNTQRGGKRLGDDAPVGSPTGKLLLTLNGVQIDFSQVAAEGLRTFNVDANGQRVASLNNPQPRFTLSAKLVQDVEYSWNLLTNQKVYKGKFSLVDIDTQKEVDAQLDALNRSNLDDTEKLIYKAAILDEADVYSMRDSALLEARMRLEK